VAQEESFKTYNSDIDKYSFAKSFIVGLGYYHRVADRLAKEEAVAAGEKDELGAAKVYITYRTLDNAELRIAKNYLAKYLESSNGLVHSIARDTVAVYDRLLAMSLRERELWQVFLSYRSTGQPDDFSDEEFGAEQVATAREKKEVAKELIRQSILMTKALLSAERCENEDCYELALNDDERHKLIQKLDEFSQGNMAWGMKPGQSTIEACVASIREVLEDPVYVSRP